MKVTVTLKWCQGDGYYVGTTKEIPGVFSQGKSHKEVVENLSDAIRLMLADEDDPGLNDVSVPNMPSRPPSLAASVELQLPGTLEEGDEPR